MAMTIARAPRARKYPRKIVQCLTLFVLLLGLALIVPAGTVHAAQVSLAWDRNSETDLAGYIVYYGTGSRVYNWFIDVGNATTCTVTGLADGSTYYFAATAYDSSGLESVYSSEVSKSMCTYSISPPGQSFTATGGTGSVNVTTQSTCPRTASSGASWVTITSGGSGTGSGTVQYSVAANTSASSRTASSTIAGNVFNVTQAGTSGSTLTITASAGTGGTISPTGAVSVSSGASRAFTITPSSGYRVASVLVDGTSVGAVTTYTFSNVTANHTIAATFAANTNTITASAGTGGTISPTGAVSVSYGTSRAFTITPSAGYRVASVLVDGTSVGAVTTYTFSNVTANHTIAATFAANTNTITASAGTGGTISPTGAVSVNSGTSRTFTITPSTGYRVTGVLVDGTSVGAVTTYTFSNVTANHTIAASFAANTNTITASAGTGGTISPTGAVSVSYGASRAFTITPSTGYRVASVLVDGTSVGAVTTYTFSNVTANHTIAATFAANTNTITASAGTGGSISPTGAVSVSYAASRAFTITPSTGYRVASVLVDGTSVGAVTTYTFSNVTANHTIAATFAANTTTFTISAGAEANGTISPSGTVVASQGTSKTFTITPNAGYRVYRVWVDGSSVGAVTSYTLSNVTANHEIWVSFLAAGSYAIGAGAEPNGTISPSGTVKVSQGTSKTFAITPNAGYRVFNVYVDGSSVGAVTSYTLSNVTANHEIWVDFSAN
jgi:hypothetical protein